jgi:metallo-beta-lactamase family protein
VGGRSIHFTEDLGRADDPLMFPPRDLEAANVLVTESTYGNRAHSTLDPEAELGGIIRRVAKRQGVVVIAAFAVGRAETVLLHLSRLRRRGARASRPPRHSCGSA